MKFITYIAYLILSIYLNSFFEEEKEQLHAENKFTEEIVEGLDPKTGLPFAAQKDLLWHVVRIIEA